MANCLFFVPFFLMHKNVANRFCQWNLANIPLSWPFDRSALWVAPGVSRIWLAWQFLHRRTPTWANSKQDGDPTTVACDSSLFCFVGVHFVSDGCNHLPAAALLPGAVFSRTSWISSGLISSPPACFSLFLPFTVLVFLSEPGSWSLSSESALIF